MLDTLSLASFSEYDEGKLYTVQGRNPVTCLFQNQEMPLLKMMLIFGLSCLPSFFFFFSEKDVYVGYLPLAHVLELVAGEKEHCRED